MTREYRQVYYAADEGAVGLELVHGGGEVEAEAEVAAEHAEPALAEQVAAAVREALESREVAAEARRVRAEDEARVRAAQAQAAFAEPATTAMAALDMREEMFDDLRDVLTDLPKEIVEDVRKDMRSFNSYQSLQAMKTLGLHRKIADAAIGKAVREGRYVPGSTGSGPSLMREPVHSEPMAAIPSEFRREQEEVCRVLGVKLSEAELRAAWRNR